MSKFHIFILIYYRLYTVTTLPLIFFKFLNMLPELSSLTIHHKLSKNVFPKQSTLTIFKCITLKYLFSNSFRYKLSFAAFTFITNSKLLRYNSNIFACYHTGKNANLVLAPAPFILCANVIHSCAHFHSKSFKNDRSSCAQLHILHNSCCCYCFI